ncbi:hypothetical protein BDN70DRAFT_346185 [Pholiota conissans]|uniref:Uncharacterized protein n=1 Tax=Pholiota conissans TaxID=109636 RepID=A0A9P5YSX7_9AGAR|nr:hypothetical protein BDN70DRAFT_346185 [Pholiota conissans]
MTFHRNNYPSDFPTSNAHLTFTGISQIHQIALANKYLPKLIHTGLTEDRRSHLGRPPVIPPMDHRINQRESLTLSTFLPHFPLAILSRHHYFPASYPHPANDFTYSHCPTPFASVKTACGIDEALLSSTDAFSFSILFALMFRSTSDISSF